MEEIPYDEDVKITANALSDPDCPPMFGQSKTMESAPRDGTMLCLLVDYTGEEADHPLRDAQYAWTIGFNNFDHDGEDEWKFAGWCWSHDHFTEGHGKPVGWLPFNPQEAA